jgi:hypothetical protein
MEIKVSVPNTWKSFAELYSEPAKPCAFPQTMLIYNVLILPSLLCVDLTSGLSA